MSVIRLDIQVEDHETQALFANIKRSLLPTTLVGYLETRAHPWLVGRAKRRFASEGDDATGKWTPLRPATIAIREAKGFGAGPINDRTGALRRFVTVFSPDIKTDGLDAILEMPATGGINAETLKKFQTAQVGSRTPPITGRRPVLAMNITDAEAMLGLFHSWFVEELTHGTFVPGSTS